MCLLPVSPLPRTRRPHCHRALPDHLVCPDLTQLNFFKDSPWFLLPQSHSAAAVRGGSHLKAPLGQIWCLSPLVFPTVSTPEPGKCIKTHYKKRIFFKVWVAEMYKRKKAKKPKELHVSYSRIPMDYRLRALKLGGTFCKTASSSAPSRGKTHRFSQFLGPLSSGSKEKRGTS